MPENATNYLARAEAEKDGQNSSATKKQDTRPPDKEKKLQGGQTPEKDGASAKRGRFTNINSMNKDISI